ncbi:MAG: gliding motility-associated C-terminal domain-containing protein, partial [Flavobacteriales bacterium]
MIPTFNAAGPYCSGVTIAPLPTTSINGVSGSWSPAINNTSTTTYTFTPSAGQCATTATLTISIIAPANAGADASLGLCASGTPVNLFNFLGAQAQTGGTWSGPSVLAGGYLGTFNPSTQQAGAYTYAVNGTNPCPSDQAIVIITINATNSATVNYPSPICAGINGDIAPILTGTAGGTYTASGGLSINSSSGFINPAGALPGTYTVTYSIAASAGCAAFQTTTSVVVSSTVAPTFDAVGPYCSGAIIPTLPTTSTNGISGSWSPSIVNTTTTTYTFTPAVGQCANATTLSIAINQNVIPTFNAVGPYCSGASVP